MALKSRMKNGATRPGEIDVGNGGSSVHLKQAGGEYEEVRSMDGATSAEMAPYLAAAASAHVDLATALRTLPRGGVAMEATVSANYQSVKVRAWLEETFPTYDKASAKKHYESLVQRVEYVLSDTLSEAREAFGI